MDLHVTSSYITENAPRVGIVADQDNFHVMYTPESPLLYNQIGFTGICSFVLTSTHNLYFGSTVRNFEYKSFSTANN